MKTKLLLVLFLCSTIFVYAQDTQQSKVLYKRVNIPNPTSTIIQNLDESGIDLTCGAVQNSDKIQLELNEFELHKLDDLNIRYTVLIEDLSKFYSERAINDLPKAGLELQRAKLETKKNRTSKKEAKSISEVINNVGQYIGNDEIDWAVPVNWKINDATNYPSETNHFGGCLTFDMVKDELDLMRTKYPHIISKKVNASSSGETTIEGRTVWMVRISDNPDTDEPEEPETLYQSLIHSREAATIMNQLYFMWYLLENYDSDPAIKNLINNQALYFIPVFNPDGFVYNQTQDPDGGGMQRKNRNTSASGSCSTYLEGIDLNRNSAYYWGNGGSSTDSCNDTYMGTGPFSEKETQIMKEFCLEHDFKLALNHHSYKNAMLHAYAGTAKVTNPRPDEYSKYSHDFSFYNRYLYGPSSSITSINSGNMNDWMLGGPAGTSLNGTATGTGSGKHTMSWTPENGSLAEGGFWPTPTLFDDIAKRAMRMNFMAAYFSGKYAKLHDLTQSNIIGDGDLSFAIENLGQNGNDSTPLTNEFTLTVTAVTSNISITAPGIITENFTAAQILDQRYVNLAYALDAGIQAGDKIEYKVVLTNDNASDNVLYEANIVKYYEPSELVIDNPDTENMGNWTGSWVNTTDGFLGTKGISSTVYSTSYTNGESKIVQLSNPVNLTGVSETMIQFYAKWDLERSFDYVQLEGSTDGNNWTPLNGNYTKPGSPDAEGNTYYSGYNYNSSDTYIGKTTLDNDFQPDWEPLYDGDTQGKWVMEEVVIDGENNSFLNNQSTVYIRFNFKTDARANRQDSYSDVNFEGFTFDDFKIIGVQIPCVLSVPTSIVASDITTVVSTISWDNIPSATYDLRYRIVGAANWIDVADLSASSKVLTGLTASTNYEVQVRSKCSASNVSEYSTSETFTTADIVPCTGTVISSFPYDEDLNSGIGDWTNSDGGWTSYFGTTPSNTSTGPSSDADGGTTTSSRYLYTESSSGENPGFSGTAELVSPCFDLSGMSAADFSFKYHMYGSTMGTLSVKISIDNGDNWIDTSFKEITGNLDSWLSGSINLNSYLETSIKIKFIGITGSSFRSDMAIDNFNLTTVSDLTWTGATNNDWATATNWSPAIVPSATSDIIIPSAANISIGAHVSVSNLTIGSGAILTVNEGVVLTNTGTITNGGSIVLKSSATGTAYLLSDNSVENITQERYLTSNQRGWRLLSNPLSVTTFASLASNSLIDLGPSASGEYNSATNTWSSGVDSDNMLMQQAYKVFIRGLSSEVTGLNYSVTPPNNVTIKTIGTAFNTVPSSITTIEGQFYLIANPYTAPVSVSSILAVSTGLSSTVSYYDPTKASNGTNELLVKKGGYNANPVSGTSGSASDVVIPPMGSIFVQAASAGSINIPKTTIYTGTIAGEAGNYNHKTTSTKNTSSAALTINVNSNGVNFDKLQLRFKEVGTAGNNIDFGKLPNTILNIYSITEESKKLAVAELELKEQIIPLGIGSKVLQNFTFHVVENSIPAGFEAVLEDKLLNTKTILVEGTDYNFNIDNTTNSQGEERFSIALKPLSSLLAEDEVLDSVIKIWPNPAVDQFNILNNNSVDVSIQIFTMKGQLIETKKVPSGVTEVIETHGWAAGVYMLKLTNNGTQIIKKLIIE